MALRPKAWSDSGWWKTIPDLTQSEPGWAKGEPKQTDLRVWREKGEDNDQSVLPSHNGLLLCDVGASQVRDVLTAPPGVYNSHV